MPKPITPDRAALPKHDSIAACIYHRESAQFPSLSQSCERGSRCRAWLHPRLRTALTLGSLLGPICGATPPSGFDARLMVSIVWYSVAVAFLGNGRDDGTAKLCRGWLWRL